MALDDIPRSVAPESDSEAGPSGAQGPYGIGGWLSLIELQNIVALIASIIDGYRILNGFASPTLINITAFIAPALLMSGIAIILNIATLVSMSRRSTRFPAIFVITLLWRVLKNVIEIQLLKEVAPHDLIDPAPLTSSIIWAVIWILYVLRSKRVKNTFRAERGAEAKRA